MQMMPAKGNGGASGLDMPSIFAQLLRKSIDDLHHVDARLRGYRPYLVQKAVNTCSGCTLFQIARLGMPLPSASQLGCIRFNFPTEVKIFVTNYKSQCVIE